MKVAEALWRRKIWAWVCQHLADEGQPKGDNGADRVQKDERFASWNPVGKCRGDERDPHIRHHFDGQSRSEHQRRVVTGQIVSQKPQSDPCQPRAQKSDLLRQKKMAKDRVAENWRMSNIEASPVSGLP